MSAASLLEKPVRVAVTAAEDLVEAARRLVPSLHERAERISANRCLPEDVVRDLYDAGLMEIMKPRDFGGAEHGYDTMNRIGRVLGQGDGSTCWVYLVTGAHDVFVPLYPAAVQEEYWTSKRPVGASSYIPTGKAAPTSGGFTLSGKWSFCSGIDLAGWVLLGAIVGMLENPTRPDMRFFLVPSSQYKIIDDWHVMGLRGTGSKSVVLDEVFVPNERILNQQQISHGHKLWSTTSDPAYHESVWLAIGYSLATPATGVAQTAYDAILRECRGRIERRDPAFEARKPLVQSHLAEASALIDCSDLIFESSMERSFARVAAGVRLTDQERVRNRRDTCYSVLTARKAGEILMGLAGGRGISETHPVQRALRDLYAISAHPATGWDSPALSFGSVALGGRPTEFAI